MDALVAAAKKEGTLNVITLPRTWANYGKLMDDFTREVRHQDQRRQPGRLQRRRDHRAAARQGPVQRAGRRRRRQLARAAERRPVRAVQGRDVERHPGRRSRTPNGAWYGDYGGYITFACDASKIAPAPCPTSFADLIKPANVAAYKGKVAINGDPTAANAAFSGGLGGGAGQRRLARQHPARHRLLREAEANGDFNATQSSSPRSSRAPRRSRSTGSSTTRSTPRTSRRRAST